MKNYLKDKFNIIDIHGAMFFLCGIFSTMQAIQVCGNTLFYMSISILIIYQLLKLKFRVNIIENIKDNFLMLLFFLTILFSLIFSFNGIPGGWLNANIKKTIVTIVLFGGIVFLFSDEEKNKYKENFYYGFKVSVAIQMIWGWLQLILWDIFKISLNEIIFGKIYGDSEGTISWTILKGDSLRLTGISWEPAYFSLALVCGYILSKSIYVKLAYVLCCLLSSSRTGIIVIMFAIIMDLVTDIFEKLKYKKESKNVKKAYIIIGIVVILIVFVLPYTRNKIFKYLYDIVNWNKTTSGGTHFNYIKYAPVMLMKMGLLRVLFGYGIASSGLPYNIYFSGEFQSPNPWSVESDVLTLLLGIGLLGCLLYYICIANIVLSKTGMEIKKLVISIALAGIFYVYIGTWTLFIVVLESQPLVVRWRKSNG